MAFVDNPSVMRQRDIFWFWLPLFASWLLMTAEGPIVTAAINRLPDEVIMLAAMGIVVSLSVAIESPIMNMLATATALVHDRQSYLMVRRYTIHWSIVLTIISALFAFTPVFDLVVVRWMDTPPDIAIWVRPGMQIMIFWTAAIAWRRFLQGVLIHFGYTRYVAWGTLVRLIASGGTAVLLAIFSAWPGVIIGATALMAGVVAEALYATYATAPLQRNELQPVNLTNTNVENVPESEPLSYGALFRFHIPLAGTSVLTLLAQPMVTFSLARLDNPTRSLAAWPLIFQIILMSRAAAMALPEIVIALTQKADNYAPVRRFSLAITLASALGMILLVFTPALPLYLIQIQDTEPVIATLAAEGTRLFLFFPPLFALVSWLRGLLISRHETTAVNVGMALNLVATAAILVAGVIGRYHGITVAAVALNVATVVELIYLLLRTQQLLGTGLFLGMTQHWSAAPVTLRRGDRRP